MTDTVTRKRYYFDVQLCGDGTTPEEAWEDCCESFSMDPGDCPPVTSTEELNERMDSNVAHFCLISAEAHSDDHIVEVGFDAMEWFKQASDDEISKLAACGWGGDYPADVVAIWQAGKDKNVAKLFQYLNLVSGKKDHPGFECSVEPTDAIAWLAKNRPTLAAKLDADNRE